MTGRRTMKPDPRTGPSRKDPLLRASAVLPALLLATALGLAACEPGAADSPNAGAEKEGDGEERMNERPEEAAATTAADALGGTTWQLRRIRSADDAVDEPRNPAEYTLRFDSDGRAAVRADCNRGGGSWTTDGASLSFGPLAMTRAMCPRGSLHDRFVAQLALVRSYRLQDGRLHLVTAADGAIIEFEPLAE